MHFTMTLLFWICAIFLVTLSWDVSLVIVYAGNKEVIIHHNNFNRRHSYCTLPSAAPTPTTAPLTDAVPSVTAKKSNSKLSNRYNIIGLQNLGNTCYLNAQIQCLYHIPYVRNLIVDDTRAKSDDCRSSSAFVGLRRLFMEMDQSKHGKAVAPSTLCQLLDIPIYEQQDSQEFWKLLLPALQVPEIIDLYTGTYENYIVALDGSNRERRFSETFLDLSLDIIPPTQDTTIGPSVVESLQQQFNQPELLSAETGNAWRPSPDAIQKVDAHKGYQLTVPGLPSILQLHLKRFRFDWSTETTIKLNHAITFPLTLDLTSIVSKDDDHSNNANDSDDCIYELQSIVVHVGEYHSGHYYSYVRPDIHTNDWYRFNDEIHTKVQFADVTRDAYGGMVESNPAIAQTNDETKAGNRLTRFFRGIFGIKNDGNNDSRYGYGGIKANAYVLQYIRRSDIAKLFDSDSD
jgi:ubiquitin C-terminal hydrolase